MNDPDDVYILRFDLVENPVRIRKNFPYAFIVYLRRLSADPREIGGHDAASCPPISPMISWTTFFA